MNCGYSPRWKLVFPAQISHPEEVNGNKRSMTEDEMKAHEAFEEYRALKARADVSMKLKDAEAAGAAWARFIDLFLPADNRLLSGKVVPIHRRAS